MKRLFLTLFLVLAAVVTTYPPAHAEMLFKVAQAANQQLSVGTESAATEAAVKANQIMMFSTIDCYVAIGSAPTATASGTGNIFLPAYTFIGTETLQTDKVAAITASGTGVLYIYSLR